MNKVAVFLTAYNEESNIGAVLDGIPDTYATYVIDDGSTDGTRRECSRRQISVIRHPVNIGQGNAVLTMFAIALQSRHDVIVAMDADGQHDPAQIPGFLRAFATQDVDVVQGSRVLGHNHGSAPWARRAFLRPLTALLNLVTGYRLTDAMCGFRAYRVAAFERAPWVLERLKEPEYMVSELWIRLARAGFRVAEVPIALQDRGSGASHKGLFRYGWGVASAILHTVLEPRDMAPDGDRKIP